MTHPTSWTSGGSGLSHTPHDPHAQPLTVACHASTTARDARLYPDAANDMKTNSTNTCRHIHVSQINSQTNRLIILCACDSLATDVHSTRFLPRANANTSNMT